MTVDVEKRAAKRRKAEAARRVEKYPSECQKCFSPPGDTCRTIDGKPTAQHILRYPPHVTESDRRRYPAACPICKVGEGLHCKSLYSGKRVHPHRDRPMR